MQGLLIEQDDQRYVRLGTYSNGSALRVFIATCAGGSVVVRAHDAINADGPIWLRVVRADDAWTARVVA